MTAYDVRTELAAISDEFDPEAEDDDWLTHEAALDLGLYPRWVVNTAAAKGALLAAVEDVALTLGAVDGQCLGEALPALAARWQAQASRCRESALALRLFMASERLKNDLQRDLDFDALEGYLNLFLANHELLNIAIANSEGVEIDMDRAKFLLHWRDLRATDPAVLALSQVVGEESSDDAQ
ncbi:MAG: hypothetical protein JWP14_391 [Frankiales bacterium]|nr:hypothetical protein [Frankiales bacterium]